jgi:hypothetical protein
MAAPASHVRVSGTWKKVSKQYVRVGGSWKLINKAYVRVGGTWKLIGQGVTPGSTSYTTPGTYSFSVPNYNSLQVELWGAGAAGAGYTGSSASAGQPAKWDGGAASSKPQAGGGSPGSVYPSIVAGAGGTASGGDVNTTGGTANGYVYASPGAGFPWSGPWGGAGAGPGGGTGGNVMGGAGNAPGGGGGGAYDAYYDSETGQTQYSQFPGGGGAAYCKKTYASGVYAVGASVSVVVPAGPSGVPGDGGSTFASGAGARGQATITWS